MRVTPVRDRAVPVTAQAARYVLHTRPVTTPFGAKTRVASPLPAGPGSVGTVSDDAGDPGRARAGGGRPVPPPLVSMPPGRPGCLSLVGNVLWLLFAGWELAVGYLVAALLMVLPVITIPFAVQCVKLAGFSLWPFGRAVVEDPEGPPVGSLPGNVLWFVLCGWWLALGHVIAGVALVLTIVGIPFGVQCFKLGLLALWPFGRRVVPA